VAAAIRGIKEPTARLDARVHEALRVRALAGDGLAALAVLKRLNPARYEQIVDSELAEHVLRTIR
jgi:hypothetical protein